MNFTTLKKLKKDDKIAIVSPSFAAPGRWPHVYELCLQRMRDVFQLEPVEFPATKKLGASKQERAADLIAAFENREIKAVMASLGGDDQVTYISHLPAAPFQNNPKPFFGYSDNTHFANFLWLNGIPSYYGASLFTELGMQGAMDDFTVRYLRTALFDSGEFELLSSDVFNDIGLNWNDPANLTLRRRYQPSEGWQWDGAKSAQGITWGGCLESVDELLRNNVAIPSLEQFSNVILLMETSEEIPSHGYVRRVFRALGERGILEKMQGVLVGRPKAWEFNQQNSDETKAAYKIQQQKTIVEIVREYNVNIPIIQNLDFGHTAPQICVPFGRKLRIDAATHKIFAEF
jgi:muramoyltetrapeptide carboxypeptidase LdcA involved in peptidoglycan recycling